MSDIHLDYDYTPGMSIDCGKPLCCRSDSGFPQNANGGAGNWGNPIPNNLFDSNEKESKVSWSKQNPME